MVPADVRARLSAVPAERWVWAAGAATMAVLLSLPSVLLPSDGLGIRRFATPSLAPDVRLAQTFTMNAHGLHAIDVSAVQVGDRLSGDVRLELHDMTDVNRPRIRVRSVQVSAADLVEAETFRFEFAPILDSKGRVYRLDFVAVNTDGPSGVALRATKGERYDGGTMRINDADRWADLAFEAEAPAPSIWELLMTLRRTNPAPAYVIVAASIALWVLLGFVVRAIRVAGRPGARAGRT